MSNRSLGDGFNSSSLDIYLNGVLMSDNQFTSLASAQAFFTDNPIAFGSWGDELADIGIIFSLTSDQPNSGFAFDYAIGTTTPLPAALPLFATGLGALGLLGWRRKRKAPARRLMKTPDRISERPPRLAVFLYLGRAKTRPARANMYQNS